MHLSEGVLRQHRARRRALSADAGASSSPYDRGSAAASVAAAMQPKRTRAGSAGAQAFLFGCNDLPGSLPRQIVRRTQKHSRRERRRLNVFWDAPCVPGGPCPRNTYEGQAPRAPRNASPDGDHPKNRLRRNCSGLPFGSAWTADHFLGWSPSGTTRCLRPTRWGAGAARPAIVALGRSSFRPLPPPPGGGSAPYALGRFGLGTSGPGRASSESPELANRSVLSRHALLRCGGAPRSESTFRHFVQLRKGHRNHWAPRRQNSSLWSTFF
jgi:hypothetical protein